MDTLTLKNGKTFGVIPYDKQRFGKARNAPAGFFDYLKTLPLEEQPYRYIYGSNYGRTRIYAGGDETSSEEADEDIVAVRSSPDYLKFIVDLDNNVMVGVYFTIDDTYMLAGDSYTEESEEENNGAGYKCSYSSHYLTCLVPQKN